MFIKGLQGFFCSKERKCNEVIWDYWKKQQEFYDMQSDGGPDSDSQDSQDHGV